MSAQKETQNLVNSILSDMFYKVLSIQEKYVSLASSERLSRTEMHMIETIGKRKTTILSNVARALDITLATASVSMDRLVRKGFVDRKRIEQDRRKYWLELTDEGWKCFHKHQEFHNRLVDAVLNDFQVEQFPELVTALTKLKDFFDAQHKLIAKESRSKK